MGIPGLENVADHTENSHRVSPYPEMVSDRSHVPFSPCEFFSEEYTVIINGR